MWRSSSPVSPARSSLARSTAQSRSQAATTTVERSTAPSQKTEAPPPTKARLGARAGGEANPFEVFKKPAPGDEMTPNARLILCLLPVMVTAGALALLYLAPKEGVHRLQGGTGHPAVEAEPVLL